jgi:hypothetical protein
MIRAAPPLVASIVALAAPAHRPYDPTDDICDNMKRAFQIAEDDFGVPQLLDPDDPHCAEDENSVVTYLHELERKVRARASTCPRAVVWDAS